MATTSTMARSNGSHHLDSCTLSLHGFSDNDITVLRSMVSLFAHKLSANWTIQPENHEADLHIVDVDSREGRLQWRQIPHECEKVAYSTRTLISASKRLRKPLLSKQLCELLQKAGDSVILARHGGMPLVEHIERESFSNAVRIEFDDQLPELWLDPHTKLYLFGCELERIRPLLAIPFMVSELGHVGRTEWRQRAGRVDEQPLSRLYWYAAWATSDDELTPALDRTAPLRLVDWPDMECHRPEFFRLAGHLLNQAISFDQLLSETRIDRKVAAGFVNACHRCGLIGLADQAIDTNNTMNNKKAPGLFSRVRQRVGF